MQPHKRFLIKNGNKKPTTISVVGARSARNKGLLEEDEAYLNQLNQVRKMMRMRERRRKRNRKNSATTSREEHRLLIVKLAEKMTMKRRFLEMMMFQQMVR